MPEPTRTSSWQSSFGSVRAFMLKAVNTGLSFNEFYRTAQDTGISYNRQRMNTDFRSLQGIYKYENLIAALPAETIIPQKYVTDESHTVNYNYAAFVDYTYTDAITGEDVHGTFIATSEKLFSHEEYTRQAMDRMQPGGPYQDATARDFKFRYVAGRRE